MSLTAADDAHTLRLVGAQQRNPAPGDHSLIVGGFARLPKEVPHTGDVTRLLGYEALGPDGERRRFFGIAVTRIDHIPDGFVAWELSADQWVIREPVPGANAGVTTAPLSWLWRAATPVGPLGEFVARCPAGGAEPREFRLFAHVPIDRRLPGFRDDVALVDYDPRWPAQFAESADWLRTELGSDVALRIEHYGSTAIPGMPAKPVIDVLVEVPSFAAARERALPRLSGDCWEYWWYADHMVFFRRNGVMGERTAHVHLAPAGHAVWRGLAFRDYLRTHPADAARYAALKRDLAVRFAHDREAYTRAKTEFVQSVTARALANRVTSEVGGRS